jgi:hypothetical protein
LKIEKFKEQISLIERESLMRYILEKELLPLAKNKSIDYGGDDCFGNLRKSGWIGTIIRLGDKSDRLLNLISLDNENDKSVKDEAIEDTLIDIINYAFFTLIMKRGINGSKKE